MLLFHECLQLTKLRKYLFIIPWDIILTSLYFWMSNWLSATNASITLHAGDSVIALSLIINASEQQAVPSTVRWMHTAQGGCWISAALQVNWWAQNHWGWQALPGCPWSGTAGCPSPPSSRDGHSTSGVSNLLSCSEQPAPGANHPHAETKFFLHSDGVFCVPVCAETVKVMHKAQARWG